MFYPTHTAHFASKYVTMDVELQIKSAGENVADVALSELGQYVKDVSVWQLNGVTKNN